MNSFRRSRNKYMTLTCDPCRFAGKTAILAMKYCQDCHGHFCQPCATTHSKSNNTRYHTFMDLREKRKLSQTKKRSKYRCKEHDAEYVSYCEGHDLVCCHVCITSCHKPCTRIIPLADESFGTRAVRLAKDLEVKVKKLQAQFGEAKTAKVDYIKAVEQQDKTFLTAVKSFRRKIEVILNKLEDVVIKRKSVALQEKLDHVTGHVKTFNLADEVLADIYKQLDASLYTSDTDMFLNAKHVEDIVYEYTAVYDQLKHTPEKGHLRFEPDLKIQNFLDSIGELGSVCLEASVVSSKTPSFRSPISSRNSSVQPTFRKPDLSKDVNIRAKSDKFPCYITGADFLSDGRVVLADDSNKCVKLLGNDYSVQTSVELGSAPRDVAAISVSEIAVTLPDERCVQLFEVGVESLIEKRKLVLNTECYGITFHETVIYVTSGWSPEKEVQVIEPTGKVIQRIKLPHYVFKYPLYITIDPLSDTIFVTDYTHGVVALDMSGNVLYKYEDKLQSRGHYKGVTLTLPGHVLACTWQSNAVCQLHPDGRGMDSVIEWTARERRKPVAIAYAFDSKKLLVSYCGNKRDFLSIYRLS